ncbi:MAG: hypothetical protein ABJB34_11925 [Acidobacteriota bacterium]
MKIAHLLIGFTLFVVFVVTGRFMRVDFPDKEGMDQALRILARSRHIYILFSALIHLVLGIYFQRRQQTAAKIVQYGGSALLISASVFLVWAFVTETYSLQHFSDLSRNGIYMSLAGVGLHLLSGIEKR